MTQVITVKQAAILVAENPSWEKSTILNKPTRMSSYLPMEPTSTTSSWKRAGAGGTGGIGSMRQATRSLKRWRSLLVQPRKAYGLTQRPFRRGRSGSEINEWGVAGRAASEPNSITGLV